MGSAAGARSAHAGDSLMGAPGGGSLTAGGGAASIPGVSHANGSASGTSGETMVASIPGQEGAGGTINSSGGGPVAAAPRIAVTRATGLASAGTVAAPTSSSRVMNGSSAGSTTTMTRSRADREARSAARLTVSRPPKPV